jgi:hypothetical protein
MILTIAIILGIGVLINLLLLIFSSNKSKKNINSKPPLIIRKNETK